MISPSALLINWLVSSFSRIPPVVFIILITAFSFGWLLGYGVYEGDQLIYFPDVLKKIDPQLFPTDVLFGPGGFTLFDETLVAAMRWSGLDLFYVIFLFSFAVRFVYFYSIYRIAFFFTQNRIAALLAPIIFLSGFVIYGTGMRTVAPMLLPKYIAIATSLLGLSFAFERRFILAAFSLGLGFLFHPSGPLPFLAVFYLYTLFLGKGFFSWRNVISWVVPPLFLFVLYLFFSGNDGAGLFTVIDEAWRQVILRRDSYYFLSTWYYPNSAPIYIVISAFLFFLIRKELADIFEEKRKRLILSLIFFFPLGLALFSLMFADFFGSAFVTQLSFGRGLMLWKFFLNGLFVYYVFHHLKSNPRDFLYNFFLIGIVAAFVLNEKVSPVFFPALMFMWTVRYVNASQLGFLGSFLKKSAVSFSVFALTAPVVSYVAFIHDNDGFFDALKIVVPVALAVSFLNIGDLMRSWLTRYGFAVIAIFIFLGAILVPSRVSLYPSAHAKGSFMEACVWVKANTENHALFITEPFTGYGGEVRLICKRGIFATRRDGGQVVFNRDYALEWNERYDIIKRLESEYNSAFLLEVAKKYHIDYAFSDRELEGLQNVFNNGTFFIYKVR